MNSTDQVDMFNGIFDDRSAGVRVVIRDGQRGRFVRKNACGKTESVWPEVHDPWGTYPDVPAHLSAPANS